MLNAQVFAAIKETMAQLPKRDYLAQYPMPEVTTLSAEDERRLREEVQTPTTIRFSEDSDCKLMRLQDE